MFAQKLLLPAFALFSAVAAQTSACANAKTTITINSQADATQIANCDTVAGSVVVGNMTGPLDLTGPSAILGSLTVDGAILLESLSSSTIESIATSAGSKWTMNELTVMTTLQFDKLTQVGVVYFAGLKKLNAFTFPAFITKAASITITNCFLQTLDGINLKSVGTLDINNNIRLKSLSTQVINVTESLNIAANGNALVVKFPNLELASNATFRNVSSLDVPSLAKVGGSLIFDECGLATFAAPNLTEITGSVQFAGNPNLSNLTMDVLTTVGGGFQIVNNTLVTDISFPKLATVGGAIDLAGNFTTPDLPAITDVAGALNIQSTAQIDCSGFDKLKSSGTVRGSETCRSTDDPESLDPSGTSTGSSATPTKSKGVAVSYGINEAVAGLSVIGGIMQMLL